MFEDLNQKWTKNRSCKYNVIDIGSIKFLPGMFYKQNKNTYLNIICVWNLIFPYYKEI